MSSSSDPELPLRVTRSPACAEQAREPWPSDDGDDEASEPAGRLIAAAVPVFAQRGYDRATVREIAREAGVNVAAVSYYFGDKMGLYRAVIEDIRDQRQREFPAPAVGDAPPHEMLRRIVRTLLARMLAGDQRGFEAMLMMREMMSPTAVLGVLVREYFKPTFDVLRATIEQLIEPLLAGELNTQAAHEGSTKCAESLVTQVALGVVGQCLYYRIGRPVLEQMIATETLAKHYDLESLCQHITASTLAACGRFDIIQERDRLEHPSSFTNDRRIHLESNGRHEH
ncbi:CerR family C-terminal domain-containing protein [Allorhodopirellula heiligendammensis]|uniref:HTH-type transcriptional regulator YttP n=1 Tax=Allorhodopirellula heiligendammensis TaxID=2714739 RepID=A0A5C6C7L5_9BACT|nr:CerR family C-terminal domain-containing protein [Allorhodopirellula heiligendammensis]TWU20007.1 putative HTH-type transcriptional regulator YttP [Allorhodopirellula heiligendammensis]